MNTDDKLSKLYRDAVRPEPPAALDDAILAASRRAAGARPQPLRTVRRWQVPAALAATVVLTFSVTMMVYQQQQADDDAAPMTGPATAPTVPVPSASPQPEPNAAPALRARKAESAKRAAPPAAPEQKLAAPAATSEIRRNEASRSDAAAIGGATAADKASGMQLYKSAKPSTEPLLRDMAPAPAAPANAPRMLQQRAAPAEQPAAALAPDLADSVKAPDQWLAEIRALKRDGRADEARTQLEQFKRRYPDYRLPDDLK